MANCPHCGATVDPQVSFCPACGMAVAAGSGPRIIEGQSLASTSTGLFLQSEELQKKTGRAFRYLLLIAIVQFLAAGFFFMVAGGGRGRIRVAQTMAEVVGLIGLVFFGLAIWARWSPYPAAITGLVLLLTLWALDVVADPRTLVYSIFLKAIILFALFRAIQAGAQHRRLLREAGARST